VIDGIAFPRSKSDLPGRSRTAIADAKATSTASGSAPKAVPHRRLNRTDLASPPPSVALPGMQRGLVVLRIIPARRGGCEYWTMRCTRCGGIHLDIVNASSSQTAS
jgi:hypothetical protein